MAQLQVVTLEHTIDDRLRLHIVQQDRGGREGAFLADEADPVPVAADPVTFTVNCEEIDVLLFWSTPPWKSSPRISHLFRSR